MSEFQNKIKKLEDRLSLYNNDTVVVAFSGGADSTFLLAIANEILDDVMAVTVAGPNFPRKELEESIEFCEKMSIPHLTVNLEEEIMNAIKDNDRERCYHCKFVIFEHLKENVGLNVIEGSNVDDLLDYRPGRKALVELGIASPLEEAGFTKEDVRSGLRAMNISVWNKPQFACLASRIPTGEEITLEKLSQIEKCENHLKNMGFKQVRVRHLGQTAKIEVDKQEVDRLFDENLRSQLDRKIKEEGFKEVVIDWEGYKMGNMNKGEI